MKRKASSSNAQPNSKKFKADQEKIEFNNYFLAPKTTEEIYFDLTRLPLEILSDYVFKYFTFEYWLRSLIFVSKQWYEAAIQSSVDKQLLVNTANSLHMFKYYSIASRFKITTVSLTGPTLSKGPLSALLKSSPRLHTFVQMTPGYDQLNFPNMSFDFIKTACIFSNMIDLFPNATRVQFLDLKLPKWNPQKKYPNVVELAVHSPRSVSTLLASFPSLKVLHCSVNVEKEVPADIEFRFSFLANRNCFKFYSYDQVWAGDEFKSPLLNAMWQNSTADVIEELAKYSSVQYELNLLDRINEYKFPAITRQPIANRRPKKVSLSTLAKALVEKDAWKAVFYYKYFPAVDALTMLLGRDDKDNIEPFLAKNAEEISHNMTPGLFVKLGREFENATLQRIFTKEQLQRMMASKDKTGNFVHHMIDTDTPNSLDQCIKDFGPLADDWLTYTGSRMQTPIQRALERSDYRWVKYLVNAGAKIDAALLFGEEEEVKPNIHIDFIQKVIKLIRKKNANSSPDINWFFDLCWINLIGDSKLEMLEFIANLLEIKNIDEIEQDDYNKEEGGLSLFNHMIKSWGASIEFLENVVNRFNVDLNRADTNGMTSLLTAIEEKNHEVAVWLLEHGATACPAKGYQPLYELLRERSVDPREALQFIDTLLFYGADINAYTDEEGRLVTPLHAAIQYGQPVQVIEYLVARGARPDMTDSEGGTAMHEAILSHNPKVVKYLAAHVDINKPNYAGIAPIHEIIRRPNSSDLLKTLVECGADCNLPRPGFNMTPLMIASLKSNFKAIQELLQHNVNLQAVDIHGHSFVYYLVKYFKGYSMLIFKDWFTQNASHLLTQENTQFVINETKKIIELSKTDAQMSYNLFSLASSYLFLAEFLIEQVGFDINTQDYNGDVLLSYPMHRGEVQSYLLKQNPNVNIQNKDGNTPLMLALQRNEVHWFCKELVDLGADLTLKNKWGISINSIIPDAATHFKEKEPMKYFEERFKKENGLK